MDRSLEFVSIIVPCLNEEQLIGRCLDSLLDCNYPHDSLEILVADGGSTDSTLEILEVYESRHVEIRKLNNPGGSAPAAMNTGIRNAKGDIIIRADAHTVYPPDYVSECVKTLNRYGAENVGGVVRAQPGRNTRLAHAFAVAISHPFGVGFSRFRIATETVQLTDTVPFGCFRRELFNRIGEFDEDLPRNEDFDLNQRIRKAGGKILLNPKIVSYYYARGNFRDYWNHNFDNGYRMTLPWGIKKLRAGVRHLVPLFWILALIGLGVGGFFSYELMFLWFVLVGVYCLSLAVFSVQVSLRHKEWAFLFLMPVAFASLHIGYGLGSVRGLLSAMLKKLERH